MFCVYMSKIENTKTFTTCKNINKPTLEERIDLLIKKIPKSIAYNKELYSKEDFISIIEESQGVDKFGLPIEFEFEKRLSNPEEMEKLKDYYRKLLFSEELMQQCIKEWNCSESAYRETMNVIIDKTASIKKVEGKVTGNQFKSDLRKVDKKSPLLLKRKKTKNKGHSDNTLKLHSEIREKYTELRKDGKTHKYCREFLAKEYRKEPPTIKKIYYSYEELL